MRDYKKLLKLIEEYPEKSNEFLLNSSGSAPEMSQEQVSLEMKALNALRSVSPELRSNIQKCL